MACCGYTRYDKVGCNLIFTAPNSGYTTDIDLTQAEVRKVAEGKWIVQSTRSGSVALHDDDELTGTDGPLTYAMVRGYISSCKGVLESGDTPTPESSTTSARLPAEIVWSFTLGATTSNTQSYGRYAAIGMDIPAEFNGDTITFQTQVTGGSPVTVMDKVVATGWNSFDDTEILTLFPLDDVILVTSSATVEAATITASVKS